MSEKSARKVQPAKPAKIVREKANKADLPNPVWFMPIMIGFFLLGLFWMVAYYVTQGAIPIQSLGNYNILIGFGLIMVGFGMTTRWK